MWSAECICPYGDHVYLSVSYCRPHSPHTSGDSLGVASDKLARRANVRSLFGSYEKHAVICSGKAFKLCTHELSWSYFPCVLYILPHSPPTPLCMSFTVANRYKHSTRRHLWVGEPCGCRCSCLGLHFPQVCLPLFPGSASSSHATLMGN